MFDKLQKYFHALKTSENHWLRKTVGMLLVIGGLLGFLPVLGFWMVPLGVALLAVDYPIVRRMWRRTVVWWGRRWRAIKAYFGSKPPDKTP